MKAKDGGPHAPKYIDRPEVSEVFADRLEHLFFDGATVRMEFTVTRTDPAQSGAGHVLTEPRQWSYTASRVVLSARGAAEMLHKMQELHSVMVKQGLLRAPDSPEAAPAAPPPPPAGE
jgi:hypothetical protein